MKPYYSDEQITLHHGDALAVLKTLPDASVDCCVTSPPYFGLRDYGTEGQYGLEASPAEYVETMRTLFTEVRRVLADDGTLWLNLGSSYMNPGPSGTQGKTGQRATRTFTAEGLGAGAVRRGAPRDDTACTGQSDCQDSGCACSGLCGGCAASPSHRSADSTQPSREAALPPAQTDRGISRPDCVQASPDASPRDVHPSTTQQSAGQHPGTCSHCRNCGACLAVLGSSARDARLCARRAGHTSGTSQHGSDARNQGRDALGTAWLNYSELLGSKSLIATPWMVAMALQVDGWILRNDIIWAKPNAMPESVTDRLSTRHEHLFMFSKSPRYWFDLDAVREPALHEYAGPRARRTETWSNGSTGLAPHNGTTEVHPLGRNPGDVWEIATQPFSAAHFAVMPQRLAERAILAGCKSGGTVLDPFSGSGTTGLAATKHGRRYVGIDLSAEYLDLSLRTRFADTGFDFNEVGA